MHLISLFATDKGLSEFLASSRDRQGQTGTPLY
jgi:hypothetical protein